MIMRKYLFSTAFFLVTQLVLSQGLPSINNLDNEASPIVLKDLHISVFVIENIATTTMEMNFYNDNNRVMQGELNFPLSNGVTISRFALDVNGEMREGVVVEKEIATQAFEAVTRRNVDPGLVEVTKGNNFKARVYPIPAKGHKKAIIAFEQEINGDAKNYIYQLPLSIENTLNKFSVRVEVVKNKPKVLSSKNQTINLEFTEARNAYISEYQELNKSLESHLTFAIPKYQQLNKVYTYKGTVSSDNYFYANLNIKPEQRRKIKPQTITLLWDVSSSAKNRDLNNELKVLEGYLKWMDKGQVNLITFSNTTHKNKNYHISEGLNEQLFREIKSEKYDGGSNIRSIDFSIFKTDEILIFSDGISNFGENKRPHFKSPILAVNSSNIADHNLLEFFSTASNGTYINIFETPVGQAIDIATHEQKQFINADFDTNKIKNIFPKNGIKISDHFSVSGIIEGRESTVTLHFGFGNEVTESKTITIDNTHGIKNDLGERIWAQKKLKTLLVENEANKIKAHGKKFNLVTSKTSLVVLDEIEDYIQYEIVPPASLQSEYFERIASRSQKNREEKHNRISNLCNESSTDYNWWKTVVHSKESPIKDDNNNRQASNLSLVDTVGNDGELEEAVMVMEADNSVSDIASSPSGLLRKRTANTRNSTLEVSEWDSNASYINSLKSVDKKNVYMKYLELKSKYTNSPSFYFDVATYMFQKSLKDEGLRVISNLAELELENTEILRTLGRKLFEFEFYNEAEAVFKEVLESRSFEPHSYIDLGLTYNELGEHQKAIENLYTVIEKNWDADIISRFRGIELITLHDINNIISQNRKIINTSFIDSCFLKHMPVDIRVVIDWDANETDIDLWITDPNDEKCSYSNKNTRIGGRISNDITQGYGPEEFRLKHAIDGQYIIEVKYFGSSKQTVFDKVTIRAIVYTNFGTIEERKEVLTLQLEPQKGGDFKIGEIGFTK